MKRWYVEKFKELIEAEIADQEENQVPSPDFIEGLFPKLLPILESLIKTFRKQSLDRSTLEGFFNTAAIEYKSIEPTRMGSSDVLDKQGFVTWLDASRFERINWNYSERYFAALSAAGRSNQVVSEIEARSKEIVGRLGDPESKVPFYSKGLVVGEVQSGKTGNFNAVINRAIDSGYSLIIVFSGILEDLRKQTQLRLEEDVIGEGTIDVETGKTGQKGVASIHRFGPYGDDDITQIFSVTSYETDFSTRLLDQRPPLNQINILVCKKNHSIIANLINWLYESLPEGFSKHSAPVLVLDDEADNASLNNLGKKGRDYASKVNGHIRALLGLFEKKSYLGYTATPFANVLQDRNEQSSQLWQVPHRLDGVVLKREFSQVDNLFPDDFIVLLKSPSNYVGAKQIFETLYSPRDDDEEVEKLPLIAPLVTDHVEQFPTRVYCDPKHGLRGITHIVNKDHWEEVVGPGQIFEGFSNFRDYQRSTDAAAADHDFPRALPASLIEAVLCFLLVTAVRESRVPTMQDSALYQPHNTMLIHVSRFARWQDKTKLLVEALIEELKASIKNDDPTDAQSIYSELERVWHKHFSSIVGNLGAYLNSEDYVDEFMRPIAFDAVRDYLPDIVGAIDVKALNSSTKDQLKYKKNSPLKIIAIGGNRLSRGFTLEGLTINYFVRTTNYSDTLFQMGRWFGYRPGYLDCCRIFTTGDAFQKFNQTTRTVEELEIEFRKMAAQPKRNSPSSYLLRVRKTPGTLKITRPGILKDTETVRWSYQDSLQQTTTFDVSKEKIEAVWSDFRRHVAPRFKSAGGCANDDFFTYTTDADGVLDLLNYENNFHPDDLEAMKRYIVLCKERSLLTNWTIAVKTTGRAKEALGKGSLTPEESGLPGQVQLAERRASSRDGDPFRDKFLKEGYFTAGGKSANILSAGSDFSLTLSSSEMESAVASFVEEKKAELLRKDEKLTEAEALELAKKKSVPPARYRALMREDSGLLVIYLFDAFYTFLQTKGNEDLELKDYVTEKGIDLNQPLVGYAIAFPPISNDPSGEYVHGDYDLDDYDDEDEPEASDLPEDDNAE